MNGTSSTLVLVSLAVAISGCAPDTPTNPARPHDRPTLAVLPDTRNDSATTEFPVSIPVNLSIRQSSAWIANGAKIVRVSAVSRTGRGNHRLRIDVLGRSAPRGQKAPAIKPVAEANLIDGATQSLEFALSADLPPGVYLIRGVTSPIEARRDARELVSSAAAELWVVVDSNTVWTAATWAELQSKIDLRIRHLEFGSYGRFMLADELAAQAASLSGVRSLSGTPLTARFTYNPPGTPPENRLSIGAGVPVRVTCGNFEPAIANLLTDVDGRVTLPDVDCFNFVMLGYLADQYVTVKGSDGSSTYPEYASCAIMPLFGGEADCRFGSDYGAVAFVRVRAVAARAAAGFGRTRAQINVTAGTNPQTAVPTNFVAASNLINIAAGAATGDYGEFAAAHEYGHAFHNGALEPWASYSCVTPSSPSGEHEVQVAYTKSCAYVEGFADFFAAYFASDRMSFGYTFSASGFEPGPYRTLGAGELIEGAFASLLLDLVDGPADADGIPGDDDTMQYPLSFLDASIRTCDRAGSGGFTRLDGTDQIVYCLERALNTARASVPSAYQPSWRTWSGSLSLGAIPAAYSQSKIRAAWRWNFYGQGGLQ